MAAVTQSAALAHRLRLVDNTQRRHLLSGGRMAEFPALPLFTDAFIADTAHLTAQQTGAYLMLLMVAWRTHDCCLPDDDKLLARYARMEFRAWKYHKSIIMDFWDKTENGKWYQARLLDERKYVEDKRNKNVTAGKASALKRHETRSTYVPTEGQHKPNEPHPTPPSIGSSYSDSAVLKDGGTFRKIYEFGVNLFPSLAPKNTSEITKWVAAGCDPDLDVYPTMRQATGRDIRSWNYFTGAIMDAKASRQAPLPAGTARSAQPEKKSHARKAMEVAAEVAAQLTKEGY